MAHGFKMRMVNGKKNKTKPLYKWPICLVVLLSCQHTKINVEHRNVQPVQSLGALFKAQQLTAGNASSFSPALSSDGEYIVYSSDKRGSKDLWIRKTIGGFAKPITDHSADDFGPAFSNNRRIIAFVSRRLDATGDIHVIKLDRNLEEGKLILSVSSPETVDTHPSWFADGKTLVFASRHPGEIVPRIMTASLDNPNPIPLVPGLQGEAPSISADGQKIVYSRDGNIFFYDLKDKKEFQLTSPKLARDGQPSFSPDGKSVVFIRYMDDTNRDGQLDASDLSTIWLLNIDKGLKSQLALDNLYPIPLTSSEKAAYYPRIHSDKLFFAQENDGLLDIYSLPVTGASHAIQTVDDLNEKLQSAMNDQQRLYLLRRASAESLNLNNNQLAKHAVYELLKYYVLNRQEKHANLLNEQISWHFKDDEELQALAKLELIKLQFDPYRLESEQLPLASSRKHDLINLVYAAKSQMAKPTVEATSLLIEAHIEAASSQFFKSMELTQKIIDTYPALTTLVNEATLLQVMMIPRFADQETTFKKITDFIKNVDRYDPIILRLSNIAVYLAKNTSDQIKNLQILQERSQHLPVLPALSHLEIVKIFQKQDKTVVAINELNDICKKYDDSPQVLLEAAKLLSELAIQHGREEDAFDALKQLAERTKDLNNLYSQQFVSIFVEFVNTLASKNLAQNRHAQALKLYEIALLSDSNNIMTNRGIIEASFKDGKLPETIKKYQKLAQTSHSPVYYYLWGLATTFRIDQTSSISDRLSLINESINILEKVRDEDSQIKELHLTLGWLYSQKQYWTLQYERFGGLATWFGEGWNTLRLGNLIELSFDYRVLNPFAKDEPNWLEHAIDSYLLAYYLSEKDSAQRVKVARNLANAFYELNNFPKALKYYVETIKQINESAITDKNIYAIFYERAGRSAFQVNELKLAKVLQEKALSAWQTTDDKSSIEKAIDALALTLQEMHSYNDAIFYYKQLLLLQNNSLNTIKTHANIGYCYYSLSELNKALEAWQQSEQLIDKKIGELSKNQLKDAEFLYTQKLTLETYRMLTYMARNDINGQLSSLQKKYQIVHKKREWFITNGNQNDKYALSDLATLSNNIGTIQYSLGRFKEAYLSFSQSLKYIENMDEGDKWLDRTYAQKNIANIAKINIDRESSKIKDSAQLDKAFNLLDAAISFLQKKDKDLKPEERVTLADLLILHKSLIDMSTHKINTYTTQDLIATLKPIVSNNGIEKIYYKWNQLNVAPTDDEAFLSLHKTWRNNLLDSPAQLWRHETALNLWDEAYKDFRQLVQTGHVYKNLLEKNQVKAIFEKIFAKDRDSFDQVLDFLHLELFELANRIDKLATAQKARTLYEWLSSKIKTEINSDLSVNEAFLVIYHHKDRNELNIFIQSPTEKLSSYQNLAKQPSKEDFEKAIANSLAHLQERTNSIKHFYISTTMDIPPLAWPNILKDVSFSYLLTPALLGEVKSKQKPENFLGALIRNDLSFDEISSERYFEPLQFNQNIFEQLSHFHLIDIKTSLNLNSVSGERSFIGEEENSIDHVILSQLLKVDFPNTRLAVFETIKSQPETMSTITGLSAVSLVFLKSGIPNIIFNSSNEPLDLKNFNGNLENTAGIVKKNANLIYFGAISHLNEKKFPDDIEEIISQNEDLLDTQEEDGEWLEHVSTLSKLLFWQNKLNHKDEVTQYLQKMAASLYKAGKTESAFYTELYHASLLNDPNDLIPYCKIILNSSAYGFWAKRYDDVQKNLSRCEKIFINNNENILLAQVFHYKALICEKKRQYRQAISHYQRAKELYEKEEELIEVGRKLVAIGNIYLNGLSSYQNALENFAQAEEIFREEEQESELYNLEIDRANALIAMGQGNKAITHLKSMLEKVDPKKQLITWIRATQNIAIAHYRNKSLNEAELAIGQIESLVKEVSGLGFIGADRIEAGLAIDALNLKAMLYAEKGRFGDSFSLFDFAIGIADKYSMLNRKAFLLSNYGFWLREIGDFEKSLTTFEQVYKIDETLASEKDLAFDNRNMALTLISMNRLGLAETLLINSLSKSREIGLPYNEVYALLGLGDLNLKKGNFSAAKSNLEEASKKALEFAFFDFHWRAQVGLSKIDFAEQRKDEGKKRLLEVIAYIETLPPGQRTNVSKSKLLSELSIYEVYSMAVEQWLADSQTEQAFILAERGKHRQFIDLFASYQLSSFNPKVNQLIGEIKQLRTDLNLLEVMLQSSIKNDNSSLAKQKKTLTTSLKLKYKELEQSDPNWLHILKVHEFSLKDYLKQMPPNTITLAFWVGPEKSFTWHISQNKILATSLELTSAQIKQKTMDYSEVIANYSEPQFIGQELSNILLSKWQAELNFSEKPGNNHIVFIPHMWLHQLSFGSLPFANRYLLELFNISYLPHAYLAFSRKNLKISSQTPVYAFYHTNFDSKNPIPFTKKEIESIERHFNHVNIVGNHPDSADLLKKITQDNSILHIATHGLFDPIVPSSSSLLMTKNSHESYFLDHDILKLNFSPSLVVLSACESAKNIGDNGEEAIGLDRAFLNRHAIGVISSLWRIDDVASAVIMKRFYRYMSEGIEVSHAIRDSQLLVKQFYNHPAYWAGFKYTGM